jgi:hypothetical protein
VYQTIPGHASAASGTTVAGKLMVTMMPVLKDVSQPMNSTIDDELNLQAGSNVPSVHAMRGSAKTGAQAGLGWKISR